MRGRLFDSPDRWKPPVIHLRAAVTILLSGKEAVRILPSRLGHRIKRPAGDRMIGTEGSQATLLVAQVVLSSRVLGINNWE